MNQSSPHSLQEDFASCIFGVLGICKSSKECTVTVYRNAARTQRMPGWKSLATDSATAVKTLQQCTYSSEGLQFQ